MKQFTWKKVFALSMFFSFTFFGFNSLHAQLTGTKTIPTDYASVSAFVADLNTVGVGTSGVTLNVPAGYVETLTAQLTITATGTATDPIIIQKSGPGANPVLTSYVGANTPTSASRDGMLCLLGTDYLTINGINFQESASNTTELTCMEYAIGLLKASVTDGCQNNTIKNCVITLNRLGNTVWTGVGHVGSTGIAVLNCTNLANTALVPTAASGSNSNNKIESNTIQNVNAGIILVGYAAPTPFTLADQLNTIGGLTAGAGNSILNFGGATAAINAATGIFAISQWDLNCSYNTVNNNNGSGINHVSILRGILLSTALSASANCNNNTVTVHSAGTTGTMSGIENSSGSTAAGNTVNINNNTVTGSYLTATTGTVNGIINGATPTNLNMLNNTFIGFSYSNAANTGTGQILGIANQGAAVNVLMRNNIVNNLTRTGTTGGNTWGVLCSSGTNNILRSNSVSNISITGAGATGQIIGLSGAGSTSVIIDSNTITNLSILKSTATSSVFGISNSVATTSENYNVNTISNLTHQGTGAAIGMSFTSTSAGSRTVSNNLVHTLTTVGLTATGITLASSSPTFFNNKIYNIESTSIGAPTVSGLAITTLGTAGTANIHNNLIGDLRAPNANSVSGITPSIRGINLTATTASTNINIRHNTVLINATSVGANFSTTAIFHTTSATATAASLTIQSNIFQNTSTPNGTGMTAALTRSSTATANMNNASNRNNFFSGQPGTNRLVYFDGTNSHQTVAAFQAFFPSMGANSISVSPNYLSTTGSAANYLRINAAIATLLESGGQSGLIINTDIDGDIRQGFGGYTGTGTLPDIGADEFEGTVPPVCSGTPVAGTIGGPASLCTNNSATLTLPGATNATGLTYQWKSSTTAGGPYTNVGTISTYFTGALTATMYYVADVTCSGNTVTTPEFMLTVNPNPVVAVTGANSVCIGSSIPLTASGATTYTWSPSATLSASTGTTVNASPTTGLTYTVVGTVTATGCFASATHAVTTLNVPTITSTTALPTAVCSGGSSQLNVTAMPLDPPNAMVFNYSAGTYAEITGGTTLGIATNDDDSFNGLPIGFGFAYNGVSNTVFGVNANGFISIGTTIASSYNPISTGGTNNIISAFGNDLQGNVTTGNLSYLTTGTAPNRVLTVQWKSYRTYFATGEDYNFQIKLYEADHSIQVLFGTMTHPNAAITREIGLRGSSNLVFNNRATTTDYAATTAGAVNTASCTISPTVGPASGTTFTWTYPPTTNTFAWTPTATLNNSTIANPLASNITATTTYIATVTLPNGCAATGNVTVTSGTALTSNASISPSPTVCVGENITLNSTPIGGGGPYSYAWTGPNGFTSNLQNPTISSVGTINGGAYSVTITDACLATSVQNLSLTVNAVPTVAVTPASATFCSGGAPVALAASGANTYAWSPAAGLSATTGASVTASPTSAVVYTVTGTNTSTGCSASATTTIAYGIPMSISAVASPDSICVGSTSQLTASLQPLIVNGYSFATSAGTYTPITTGTVLGIPTNDDTSFPNLPIGFSFKFKGATYTNFSAQSNGFIALGALVNSSYNAISTGTSNEVIAALNGDLQGNATTGELRYLTSGTAPNRVLTVQWKSYGHYASTGDENNFQIKLYETSNTIQVIYGSFVQNATLRTREVGLRGASNADFNNRSTSTNWAATTSGTVNTANCTLTTAIVPATGTTYTWSTPTATYAWTPSASLVSTTGTTVTTIAIPTTTTFNVTSTSSLGCTLSTSKVVVVKQHSTASINKINCGTYVWPLNSTSYPNSGTYTATIPNAAGCDSVVTMNLTINQNSTASQTVTNCGSYTWPLNSTVYPASGTFTATIPNAAGCDSVVTLNLTVNQNTTATVSVVNCGTYVWPLNGTTYTASGVYTHVLPNAVGCDSTVTMNLTINQATSASQTVTNCGTYVWALNGLSYAASGTYIDTITNATGCDSIVTLNLTINQASSATQTVVSCDAYVWALNGLTYSSTGTYVDTIPNAAGCDSVVTLDLTVVTLDLTVANASPTLTSNEVATGATYQWIDCGNGNAPIAGATSVSYTATVNGSYAVIVTKNNCSDTSTCQTVANIGLKEIGSDLNVTLSPNPTNDFVIVQFADLSTLSIEIMDATGKVIATQTQIANGEKIDLRNFERGVYMVRMNSDKGTKLVRIIKQ